MGKQHNVSQVRQKDCRKAETAKLLARGFRQSDIARMLEISKASVSNYAKELDEELKAERIADMEIVRDRELAKLDEIEREAWQEWEDSKADAIRRKTGVSGTNAVDETTTTGQTGNTSYLNTIIKCNERRCKMLGLDAPDMLNVKGSLDVVTQEVVVSNREQARQMITFEELTQPSEN